MLPRHLQRVHTMWLRAERAWTTFRARVAKHVAHFARLRASLWDRQVTCSEAGLAATEDLASQAFLMSGGNDNTRGFMAVFVHRL